MIILGAKLCLLSLKKRLNHRDPHVVLLALSLLDSLWSNCGLTFRREVSSREFSQELSCKATHHEPSLGLIETLYKNLVADGQSFEPDNPPKSRSVSTDPNAVQSAEEEEALMLAIAKSLQETSVRNNNPPASSLYPSTASTGPTNVASVLARPVPKPEREVRALYDFEAAEDNEL
ncbi:unnamed protein product, partial [Gongylonema pulchrum]